MSSRVDLILRGGTLVTAADAYEASVAVEGERIVAIGPDAVLPDAEREIDVRGKLVFPGAIDCHIHLGPEYDDWRGGPHAAAHAGLTTLVGFGVPEAGETLPQAVHRLREEASRGSVLDFGFHLILPPQPDLVDGIPEAVRLGISSFKLFMTYKKRGRMCSDEFICRVMERIAAQGGVTQLHCENGEVVDYLENKAIAEGRVRPADFPPTCPDWIEEEAVNRAVKLGALTGSPVYVVHLSSQLGLERIKQAQATGQRVWAETCPQYLLLTDAEMETWGPLAKIGPPLRPAGGPDREALWRGAAQGFVSTVASDHSPRSQAAKAPGWKNIFVDEAGQSVPFGSPSVETLVPLVYGEGVVKRGLPPSWMARVLAENPARIFGLYPRKGVIRVGADADFLIVDPEAAWTIRVADQKGMAGWTLYEGWPVKGRPWMTLLRGQVVLNQGKLEQAPGYGQYLPRGGPVPPIAGAAR